MNQGRQTFMFSATFPREIQRLASDFMQDYVFLSVGRVGAASKDVKQSVMYVENHDKPDSLMRFLATIQSGLILVFVETKRGADYLEDVLCREGFPAASIHGDKTQREREGTRGDAPLARRLPRGCVLTHEGERRVVRVARVRGLEQHRRLGGEGAISRVSAERPDRDGSPTQVGHAVPAHATGVVSQTGSVLGHDAIEVDASGGRRGRGHSARGVVTDPGTAGAFS